MNEKHHVFIRKYLPMAGMILLALSGAILLFFTIFRMQQQNRRGAACPVEKEKGTSGVLSSEGRRQSVSPFFPQEGIRQGGIRYFRAGDHRLPPPDAAGGLRVDCPGGSPGGIQYSFHY